MAIKHCRTCALRNPDQNVCMRFNLKVVPTEDFCSWWAAELLHCANCGRAMLAEGSVLIQDEVYCRQCAREVPEVE